MKFILHKQGGDMILDDLKNFIVQNNIAEETDIKFDFDSAQGEKAVLLHLYDNTPCDLARRSDIRISIKYNDLEEARNTCFDLHDLLFPEDSFQKSIKINNKIMHSKLNKGPFYQGLDKSKRHNYILDITLTYNR